MTDKIARKFPKALATFAIAASFVSASSLAGASPSNKESTTGQPSR